MKHFTMSKPSIILCVVCSILYCGIAISGPSIVKSLYQKQNFNLLNTLSSTQENQSFEYYDGKIEDTLWGPAKSFISGIILVTMVLNLLTECSAIVFFSAMTAFLLLTKFQVLFLPPYGETVYGPFSDAIWLVRHSMDYIGLHRQPTFVSGGPLIYPLSIYPLFLAVLIKITPSALTFLITAHVVVFLFSAAIVTFFRELCLKVMTPTRAGLCAVLLLSLPLYQSMTELINLEIPCLFFAMLCVYWITKERFLSAGVASLLSLLVKDPGIITCAIFLFACILNFINAGQPKKRWGVLMIGAMTVILAILKGIARQMIIGEKQMTYNKVGLLIGWQNLKTLPSFWISLAALVITMIFWMVKYYRSGVTFKDFLKKEHITLLMSGMVVLYFGLYLNFSTITNRYLLLLIPFYLFLCLYPILESIKSDVWVKNLLAGSILFSFLCSFGLIYDRNVPNSMTTVNVFERSLEYRNDLKLHMKIAREIENNFSDYTIGAPLLIAHALNFNEMGYVKKPFEVIVYGMKIGHEGLHDFQGLKGLDLNKTIWVGTNTDRIIDSIDFPIGPNDLIVKQIESGDKKDYLFKGGFAIEKMLRVIQILQSQINVKGLSQI